MTNTMECDIDQPTKSIRRAPLAVKRRVGAGEVEQRFARGRSKAVAVEVRRKTSPIRAWRAAEIDPGQTPEQEDHATARIATATPRRPFGPEAGAGSSAVDRAARMRAIEQAWKEERARQAESEAEEQRLAEAATG